MAQIAILAVTAIMALNEGAQKRKLKYAEAQGITEAGHRKMAATTAEMAEKIAEKERMEGRALSLAAASGGGIDDPTVVNLIGDLNAEGEYRVMSRLYVGSSEATGMYHSAEMARKEGEFALEQGYVKAATTVMSQYGNFGAMGAEAKQQWGSVKGKARGLYDSFMHKRREARSLTGTSMEGTAGNYRGYV
jgi:hypothetical protein